VDQYDRLLSLDDYVFYVYPAAVEDFHDLQAQLTAAYPQVVVRHVEGAYSRTSIDFFNAIAVALEFPDDRVSWNILNERLFDLTWLPARAYLLLIDNADQFLADARDGGLEILIDIFESLNRNHVTSRTERIPQKVLLHCPPSALPDLLVRLHDAGMRFLVMQ
jgi:hypothetical protein